MFVQYIIFIQLVNEYFVGSRLHGGSVQSVVMRVLTLWNAGGTDFPRDTVSSLLCWKEKELKSTPQWL
jgi:hypothetical protein